ncbi:MAG TPA: hypothetical protein VNR64_11610 [Vicinamibacterales bacterium]|nr:hypothetical protein [Vicinamibacterales bacterium]
MIVVIARVARKPLAMMIGASRRLPYESHATHVCGIIVSSPSLKDLEFLSQDHGAEATRGKFVDESHRLDGSVTEDPNAYCLLISVDGLHTTDATQDPTYRVGIFATA